MINAIIPILEYPLIEDQSLDSGFMLDSQGIIEQTPSSVDLERIGVDQTAIAKTISRIGARSLRVDVSGEAVEKLIDNIEQKPLRFYDELTDEERSFVDATSSLGLRAGNDTDDTLKSEDRSFTLFLGSRNDANPGGFYIAGSKADPTKSFIGGLDSEFKMRLKVQNDAVNRAHRSLSSTPTLLPISKISDFYTVTAPLWVGAAVANIVRPEAPDAKDLTMPSIILATPSVIALIAPTIDRMMKSRKTGLEARHRLLYNSWDRRMVAGANIALSKYFVDLA